MQSIEITVSASPFTGLHPTAYDGEGDDTGDNQGSDESGGAGPGGGSGDDAGSGGSSGGEGGGDSGGGKGDPWYAAFNLDEGQKSVVGDRSLPDLINHTKQMRQKLSERIEQHADAQGLVKPLNAESDLDTTREALKSLIPSDPTEYLTSLGVKEGEATIGQSVEIAAAAKIGLPKNMFTAFKEEMRVQAEEADKKAGEEIGKQLSSHWGANLERNQSMIERATKQLGLGDFVNAFPTPSSGMEPQKYITLMDGLVKIGDMLREGGGLRDDPGGGQAMSLDDEINGVEERISRAIEKGETPLSADKEKLKALLGKKAQERIGGQNNG